MLCNFEEHCLKGGLRSPVCNGDGEDECKLSNMPTLVWVSKKLILFNEPLELLRVDVFAKGSKVKFQNSTT